MKTHRQCELCGNNRNLEIHHIIPRSLGGTNEIDNLIVICNVCHARLTPRGLLTKLGLQKLDSDCKRRCKKFYTTLDAYNGHLTVDDVFDVFDDVFDLKG